MEIKLIRKNNAIQIEHNDLIEEYNLSESITFTKLMEFLLSNNLNENILLTNNVDNPNDAEVELIGIISALILDYNNKVIEMNTFLDEQKNPKL
ncbi:MAG: hypothetical protein ACVCEJ_08095 [Candidatus Izemoplasmataceae bacterium]